MLLLSLAIRQLQYLKQHISLELWGDNMTNFFEPKLRFWCQKVIPLVYDDSLSYYEVLCKVVHYVNNLATDISKIPTYVLEAISGLTDASVDTADELMESDPEAGTYIATRGYHAVGDLGACLYKITDDYNEIAAAKSYLVLAGTYKWAIPVMTKAYWISV